jgi:autotransporter-associated beta strand protein
LITYSGTLVGSLANLDLSGLPGVPLALTNPPGQIALVVKSYRTPATISWTGGNGGNAWDLLTTTNWLNGALKDIFAPLDNVRFDSIGTSNLTVSLVGDLNASSLLVDSTANYTFAGSGGIIGSASLTKSNTGTLIISTPNNTFTGPTLIAGGTLAVSELDAVGFPSPLGSPPGGSTNLVLSGGSTLRVTGESYTDRGMTLNAGTNSLEVFNAADQVTVAGSIVGSGALQKLGAGTLALNVSNSYSGGTIIKAGNVSLGGGNANQYALGTGPVTLDNGTLTMFSDTSSYDKVYWNLFVPSNSTGTIYADDRCNLYGTLTGAGTLNFNVYYVRTELDGNWSGFTGQINFGTDSGGGDFRIGNTYGYSNASVNLADHISAYHISGSGVALGAVSGGPLAGMSGTPWTVGAKNTDANYAGSIYGNSIAKVGTGTWTLTGNTNTYSGVTTISGGTLQIGNGGTTGVIGTNNITDNATLAFNRSDAVADGAFGTISGSGSLSKRGAGTLTLSKAHTFSGSTLIQAGTLVVTGSGSISSSSNIMLSTGALLDVSGRTGGSMILASGKTLSGSGSVNGNFVVGPGASFAPGGSFGTLVFSNALTLAGGSSSVFEISKSPTTNDLCRVTGALTLGGILTVTNIGTNALATGDTFRLFIAGSYSGLFTNLNLPALGSGLAWDTNSLVTTGTLKVTAISGPGIGAIVINGGDVVLSGTGGYPYSTYYVVSSTNLGLSMPQWPRIATGMFDAAGNFNFTTPAQPGTPQRFFRIQLP